jgi:hypothetical protein
MKTITSPVEAFSGEVVLNDPITFPMVAAWEDCYIDGYESKSNSSKQLAMLPGIFAFAKEWHLENFPVRPTVDNFPIVPVKARNDLIYWLFSECRKLYEEAVQIPNE